MDDDKKPTLLHEIVWVLVASVIIAIVGSLLLWIAATEAI